MKSVYFISIFLLWGCKKPPLGKVVPLDYHEDLTPYRIKLSDPLPFSKSDLPLMLSSPLANNEISVSPENERIEEICLQIAQKNQELIKDNSYRTSGYKIQIFSGKREQAEEVLKEAMKNYSHLKPEIRYEQPNFKVKIGNFLTRLEAHQVYTMLSSEFPQSFIVKDEIIVYLEDYKRE
ncbi:MAG: hypothetical protein NZM38_06830 [Cytophagales bacterium]|nr:hypothetical protein [Cytophagales bacterium]MDW8384471.1 hypothetical protein [Flammeovirgaceae bacterium]